MMCSCGCPLLSQEGWLRHQEISEDPLTEQTGWFPSRNASECIFEKWSLWNHPVCGAEELARNFLDAAATPPNLGGDSLAGKLRPRHSAHPVYKVSRRISRRDHFHTQLPLDILDRQIIQEQILVADHAFGRQHDKISMHLPF